MFNVHISLLLQQVKADAQLLGAKKCKREVLCRCGNYVHNIHWKELIDEQFKKTLNLEMDEKK